jgi:hypothetical protein
VLSNSQTSTKLSSSSHIPPSQSSFHSFETSGASTRSSIFYVRSQISSASKMISTPFATSEKLKSLGYSVSSVSPTPRKSSVHHMSSSLQALLAKENRLLTRDLPPSQVLNWPSESSLPLGSSIAWNRFKSPAGSTRRPLLSRPRSLIPLPPIFLLRKTLLSIGMESV